MSSATDTARLLGLVQDAQHKLSQLEATARGLLEELSASGASATPRLRELLAAGNQLVAEVRAAGSELTPCLPAGSALPAAPNHAVVASLQELAASLGALPGCRVQLLRGRTPAGQPKEATAALLRCGRAFAAVVHLQQAGGLAPLRVGVMSAAEADNALSDGDSGGSSHSSGAGLLGASPRCLWAPSQHAVFQRLSDHAASALEHFLQQAQQGQAAASPLEMLLLWLATCGDLFGQPGGGTAGGLLPADTAAAGSGLLPLRRPCKLGWEQLWAAALNPHLRRTEPAGEAGA